MNSSGAKASGPLVVGIACRLPSAPNAVSYWSQTSGLGEGVGDAGSCEPDEFSRDEQATRAPLSLSRSAAAQMVLQPRSQATIELSCTGTAVEIVKQAFIDAAIPLQMAPGKMTVVVACRSALTAKDEEEIAAALRAIVAQCAVTFCPSFTAAIKTAAEQVEIGSAEVGAAVALENQFAAAILLLAKELNQSSPASTMAYCTVAGAGPIALSEPGSPNDRQRMPEVEPLTLLHCVSAGDDSVVPRAIEHFEAKLGKASPANACVIDQIEESAALPGTLAEAAAVIKAALALFHRTLPPSTVRQPPPSPWFANQQARTWIHPKIHPKVWSSHGAGDQHYARRAAVFTGLDSGENHDLLLEEFDDPHESQRKSLQRNRDSELVVVSGASVAVLMRKLDVLEDYLVHDGKTHIRQIAATLSSECQSTGLHLAIVATSARDLLDKISTARQQLRAPYSIPPPSTSGVYLPCDDAVRSGKTALILPGLGAAYPNMLAELCLHFCDVRAVFDFVDQLALSAGETLRPSKLIFPWPANAQNSPASTALLASMDSAVVTVLMAEYAMFMVLANLGIGPDLLIGCSTGEFATLTISGAVDIISTAPMFYRLSTSIARSVPKASLANLRTIKINADFSQVEPLMEGLNELYLSADLSPIQHLISGSRDSMGALCKRLDLAGIEFFQLPMAIPYHTPLVAGVIDASNPEIKQLDLVAPTVPTWSCSSASQYPQNVDEIRQITTELFTHPILFKQSIQQAYAQGVRKFIEVGPKGSLTPVVGEVLSDLPHLAVASNLSTGSSITTLNHMLAALASADVELSLSHLYVRRPDHLPDLHAAINACGTEWSAYDGSDGDGSDGDGSDGDGSAYDGDDGTEYDAGLEIVVDPSSDLDSDSAAIAQVVNSYLTGMSAFHEQLMSVQGDVMSAYLLSAALPECVDGQSQDTANLFSQSISDLAFIKRGIVTSSPVDDRVELTLRLDLDEHRYLLDHAVGGVVSPPHRVYLLPLTVAMEMMAQAAAVLMPGLAPIKMENIRASKRIRIGPKGCDLRIVAVLNPDRVHSAVVQIFFDAKTNEQAMSCHISFGDQYPRPHVDARVQEPSHSPRISPQRLYGAENMFHGPLLQSVRSIESVAEKSIAARLAIRPAENWFGSESAPARFLCDPLLLDNATQAVLFYLFEHEQEVTSLLPFFIDSLELFQDLSGLNGDAQVNVSVRVNSALGTECDITVEQQGKLLAKFNRLCHRRVTLPQAWESLVMSPSHTFLSSEMISLTDALPNSAMWSAARLRDQDIQVDDAILFWCADYVLGDREQEFFSHLPNARRRREWMLGRIALKDAVRRLAAAYGVSSISVADVETHQNPDGSPGIGCQIAESLGWTPIVSLTHKSGVAMAIAGHPDAARSVGIDLENIEAREEGFEKLSLTPDERARVAGSTRQEMDIAIAKIWCAKEAVGKALGMGLANNPQSLETDAGNAPMSNPIRVQRTGARLTEDFWAHMFLDGDQVVAVCSIE